MSERSGKAKCTSVVYECMSVFFNGMRIDSLNNNGTRLKQHHQQSMNLRTEKLTPIMMHKLSIKTTMAKKMKSFMKWFHCCQSFNNLNPLYE